MYHIQLEVIVMVYCSLFSSYSYCIRYFGKEMICASFIEMGEILWSGVSLYSWYERMGVEGKSLSQVFSRISKSVSLGEFDISFFQHDFEKNFM